MSAAESSRERVFPLDDEVWQTRQRTRKHGLWFLVAFVLVVESLVGFEIWRSAPVVLGWIILGFVAGDLLLPVVVYLLLPPEPDKMWLADDGIHFHRPTGKELLLKLGGRAKIRLLDQSAYLSKPHWFGGAFPSFVLFHSSTMEQFGLTHDAFGAIQAELLRRGVTLLRKRPFPLQKGTTFWEYQA